MKSSSRRLLLNRRTDIAKYNVSYYINILRSACFSSITNNDANADGTPLTRIYGGLKDEDRIFQNIYGEQVRRIYS